MWTVEIRHDLARKYAAQRHPFGRYRTAQNLWLLDEPVWAILPEEIGAEVVRVGTVTVNEKFEHCYPFLYNHVHRLLLPDHGARYYSITMKEVQRAWLLERFLGRIVQRHLEVIEDRLWRPTDGPMCRRLWNEIKSSEEKVPCETEGTLFQADPRV